MNSPISIDRDQGYEKALAHAGITRNSRLTAEGDFSAESGMRAIEMICARDERFTAAFFSNDEMALGGLCALKTRGLRVPQDVSIVGFDDIRFSRYSDPPLTTVAQPMRDIGREAMTLLNEILTGRDVPPRKRILPTQFIVRGSAARPRQP
jgi:LacI family repressor for deo operon, udp, cdd, tsx, nupC, and nupG